MGWCSWLDPGGTARTGDRRVSATSHRDRREYFAAWIIVAIVISALTPTTSVADTLVLQDGRRFEGALISRDGEQVVFEVQAVGVRMTVRHRVSSVKEIVEVERPTGPTYCILPVIGVIGQGGGGQAQITADAFIQGLDEALAARPDYIVLVIDSPGGRLDDLDRIIDAIAEARRRNRGQEFVAFVHDAQSAAAVIAMACPKVFMAGGSSIGAAVPFQFGPDGTPQNIREKWLSAIRAGFRSAARLGGHSPLLVRGMSETGIELSVVQRGGAPVVVEVPGDGESGELIKRKGEILTLTASEALACGLSDGDADSLAHVREQLGLASWSRVSTDAWEHVMDRSRSEQQQALRNTRVQAVSPVLIQIDEALAKIESQIEIAKQTERDLADQKRQANAELDAEFRRWLPEVRRSPGHTRALEADYRRQRAQITQEYEQHLAELRAKRQEAVRYAQELRRKRIELLN